MKRAINSNAGSNKRLKTENKETKRLMQVIDHMEQWKLRRTLRNILKTDAGIKILGEMFTEKEYPAAKNVKCKRCGEMFNSHYGKEGCKKYHDQDACMRISKGYGWNKWQCEECQGVFTTDMICGWGDSTPDGGDLYCFEGNHSPKSESEPETKVEEEIQSFSEPESSESSARDENGWKRGGRASDSDFAP
jgi:hypothetical protein